MKDFSSRSVAYLAATVALAFVASTIFVRPASAHDDDHKRLGSLKMKLTSDASNASRSRFSYKAKNQVRIADLSTDPRVAGATLTIRGTGANDGDSGVIHLLDGQFASWKAIGDKGWKYKHGSDFPDSGGISKVIIKENPKKGGSLVIKGKGVFFLYDIIGAQQVVEISLSFGTDVYCAQYGEGTEDFRRNEVGRVDGKVSNPPAECSQVCGNGILEVGEECDDGNTEDTDTCSNDCLGCLPQDVEFDSTFEGLQALLFDSPVYDCSNDACHGTTLSGDLDLRDGASFAQLVSVSASNPTNGLRVFPGDQDLSFLYNKIASKTLGSPTNVGTPMPSNPETVPPELLEALRLWIRGGAPETGVVEGTAELFGACLPPAAPLTIPQPDPPTVGVQLAMPGYDLPSDSETELCVPSYYDLTGVIDPDFVVPCPGAFPGTNHSGNCFAWKEQFLAQDPQSHHSIIHIYAGDSDHDDPKWGTWTCYLGANDGQACDPTNAAACPDGVCGGGVRNTTACIGFGPADWGLFNNNAPQFSGSQESTATIAYPNEVYSLLPLQGIIGWNSHAFNLTSSDTNMRAWLNLDYAGSAERTYLAGALFNADQIFTQDVLPYTQEEYCYTHTFDVGTRLFQLSSHMHAGGIRWRYYLPPNAPCASTTGCNPGNLADVFYESTDYSDALTLEFFDPEWAFDSANAADRTLKFCALYDNGVADPATVKLRSESPCPVNGCGLIPGGPCGTTSMFPRDTRNETIYCVGGPSIGQECMDDTDCPLSTCDACRLLGGVTTKDEMFIALGTFYKVP